MNYRRLSKILILGLIVILCILYCKTIDKTESQYIENRNVIDVKAVKISMSIPITFKRN